MKRIDPRTKLALGSMAIVAVLIARAPVTLVAQCLIVLVAVPLTGIGSKWTRSLRLIWPMLCLVFIVGVLFYDLPMALLLSIRLFTLLTVSFIFFYSIGPEEMGDALGKIGLPYACAFILTTAMRYVPLIGQKIRQISDAQQARGIDLRPRFKNIGNIMALLMPLLVQAFILSDDLALAMETRGFGSKSRSTRRTYHLTVWEYGLMAASLVLLVALIWWERG